MPGKDMPRSVPELERVRAINPDYKIPKLQIVPYEQALDNIGLERSEFLIDPLTALEGLRRHPTITPSDYSSVATGVLLLSSFRPEAVDYFSKTSLPAFIAMHQGHGSKDYRGPIEKFIERLIPTDNPKDLATIKNETEKAITFVEKRPTIIREIDTILSQWIEEKNAGTKRPDIEAFAVVGSFARGDSSYLSDLDLVAFANKEVSGDEFLAFRHDIEARIRQVHPDLPNLDIWSGQIFPLDNITTARQALRDADFSTTQPGYREKIFATEAQKLRIAQILQNLT